MGGVTWKHSAVCAGSNMETLCCIYSRVFSCYSLHIQQSVSMLLPAHTAECFHVTPCTYWRVFPCYSLHILQSVSMLLPAHTAECFHVTPCIYCRVFPCYSLHIL